MVTVTMRRIMEGRELAVQTNRPRPLYCPLTCLLQYLLNSSIDRNNCTAIIFSNTIAAWTQSNNNIGLSYYCSIIILIFIVPYIINYGTSDMKGTTA